MKIVDVVIIALLVVTVGFSIRRIMKKGGSCNCGSTTCPHSSKCKK